jgi:anti-anti-sigma regulatory factor
MAEVNHLSPLPEKGAFGSMPIDTDERNDARIITLHGNVDITDSLQFARLMKDTVAGSWRVTIVVLASPVINSHCLGTVLATYNALRSSPKMLKLVCGESPVLKSLAVFRIVPRVPVFSTIEDAMARDAPEGQ